MHLRSWFIPLMLLSPAAAADSALTIQTAHVIGSSIPMGAHRVPFMQIRLSAHCTGDVSVTSLGIRHEGFGASDDIQRVYLQYKQNRISRSKHFSSNSQEALIRFAPLTIKACGVETVTLAGDISIEAAAGGQHRFRVISADAGSASVSLGNDRSQADVARIVSSDRGKITAVLLPLQKTVRYGTERTIARLQLKASDERDQLVHSILLTNHGSASGKDVQHIFFQTRNDGIATEILPQLNGKQAPLTFNPPLSIKKGSTVYVELKADIRSSRKRTIRMELEEESDIVATPDMQRKSVR